MGLPSFCAYCAYARTGPLFTQCTVDKRFLLSQSLQVPEGGGELAHLVCDPRDRGMNPGSLL